MTTCIPMRALKNTAQFAQTVQDAAEPVIITTNGRETMIVMTPEYYEALKMESARTELYQNIALAEADIAAGKVSDAQESLSTLRLHYGL